MLVVTHESQYEFTPMTYPCHLFTTTAILFYRLTMPYHSLKPAIGPSVLSFDLSRLTEEVNERVTPFLQEGDYVHLDVMDGNFVNTITFGALATKVIERKLHSSPISE